MGDGDHREFREFREGRDGRDGRYLPRCGRPDHQITKSPERELPNSLNSLNSL
jgi:hypothetical protein